MGTFLVVGPALVRVIFLNSIKFKLFTTKPTSYVLPRWKITVQSKG